MKDDFPEIYISILKERGWISSIEIDDPIEGFSFSCRFIASTPKNDLSFSLSVPESYPNSEVKIILKDDMGYEHQNRDSSICLNPPPIINKESKFKHEIDKLRLWIEKYYINEEKPPHYEYLLIERSWHKIMLFDESNADRFEEKNYGNFHYQPMFEIPKSNGNKDIVYLARDIGNENATYSSTYKKLPTEVEQGIWFFIPREPTSERRIPIEMWNELLNVLTPEQIRFLYIYKENVKRLHGPLAKFFIMIGYKIPKYEEEGEEIHWELIEDHTDISHEEDRPVELKLYKKITRPDRIAWFKTENISYSRYFGRGKLSDILINSRVLIIGCGAIGSNLANILTRGGIKYLDLIDNDIIEPGNICRSEYYFIQSFRSKAFYLYDRLSVTSPYIEVNLLDPFDNVDKDSPEFLEQLKILNKYDYIFDCTTDKYLSVMIDKMQLKGTVINMSISNKAKELVVATGVGIIHEIKAKIYSQLVQVSDNPFFVGTGCYSPTFEASYADISSVLNLAVQEINSRLNNGLQVSSFIIKSIGEKNKRRLEVSYEI